MTARELFAYRWFHRIAAAGLILFAMHYGALTAFVKEYAERSESRAQAKVLNAMDIQALTQLRVHEL